MIIFIINNYKLLHTLLNSSNVHPSFFLLMWNLPPLFLEWPSASHTLWLYPSWKPPTDRKSFGPEVRKPGLTFFFFCLNLNNSLSLSHSFFICETRLIIPMPESGVKSSKLTNSSISINTSINIFYLMDCKPSWKIFHGSSLLPGPIKVRFLILKC